MPEEKEKVIFKIDLKQEQIGSYKAFLNENGGSVKVNLGMLILEWGIGGVFMSKMEEV